MHFIHPSTCLLRADTGKALRILVNLTPFIVVSQDHNIEAMDGKIDPGSGSFFSSLGGMGGYDDISLPAPV